MTLKAVLVGIWGLSAKSGFPVSSVTFMLSSISIVFVGYVLFRYMFSATSIARETDDEHFRREAAYSEMNRQGMVAAFPLVSKGEVLGYLLMGQKISGEGYSKKDLLLLRMVANQAALAYQRVRFLEMAVNGARTEMLGEIAGGFAHEIKTPLANISLPAELSIMDIEDVEKGKRPFEEVLPELKNRMKEIMLQALKASEKIEAIRQFSKPGQISLASVAVQQILKASLDLLEHLLRRTGVHVKCDLPPALAHIRGDAKQLEIVFVNLIKNAAEAMTANPTQALARELSIKARTEGDWIVVVIKDSGPGIRSTDFAHLFEAYFTTKGWEGTGMGLFLSQQVIKAHGGSIQVESEVGCGTEFTIRLPRSVPHDYAGAHQAA